MDRKSYKIGRYWEIRKCVNEGWNVYAIFADGHTMFASHQKTEQDAVAFVNGKLR